MFKQTRVCAALMFLTFVGSASAQSPQPISTLMPRESNWLVDEPIIRNRIVTGISQLEPGGIPGQSELTFNHLGIEHAGPTGNLRSAAHRTRHQAQTGNNRAKRALVPPW